MYNLKVAIFDENMAKVKISANPVSIRTQETFRPLDFRGSANFGQEFKFELNWWGSEV